MKMKSKEALVVYLGISFLWISLNLLVVPFLEEISVISIVSGILAISLIFYSVSLLRNVSKASTKLTKNTSRFVVAIVVCLAILEILLWYFSQKSLRPPKIVDVYLISGLGLILLTFVMFIIVKVRDCISREDSS